MAERVSTRDADGAWFDETQRFGLALSLVVAPAAVLMWVIAAVQLVGGRPVGDNPAPDVLLAAFWLLFGVGLPLLFHAIRLETRVGPLGVHLRLFPFHRKFLRWPFADIESAEARTYSPLREYGGWGIRIGAGGRAYNVRGNRGVQLVLRSGKRILIGSQRAEALAAAIEKGRTT